VTPVSIQLPGSRFIAVVMLPLVDTEKHLAAFVRRLERKPGQRGMIRVVPLDDALYGPALEDALARFEGAKVADRELAVVEDARGDRRVLRLVRLLTN
jgi:hypothetical protein